MIVNIQHTRRSNNDPSFTMCIYYMSSLPLSLHHHTICLDVIMANVQHTIRDEFRCKSGTGIYISNFGSNGI